MRWLLNQVLVLDLILVSFCFDLIDCNYVCLGLLLHKFIFLLWNTYLGSQNLANTLITLTTHFPNKPTLTFPILVFLTKKAVS